MKQLLRLAWRNIWRKKRRSSIAFLSVAVSVVITISLRSLQRGSYDKMIEAGVRSSGYLQVHTSGYWKDKSINDLLPDDKTLEEKIKSIAGAKAVLPRLQNVALAAGEKTSKATLVIGLSPEAENNFNPLSKRLIKGSFLTGTSRQVLLAEGLARYLKLGEKDTLVLIGQGHHGSIAAGKYVIGGIVRLPNPQMNLSTVYMPLRLAQEFNGAPGLVSAYMIDLAGVDQTQAVQEALAERLGKHFEVMSWQDMLPEIENSIRIDTTIFTLLASCLYLIVGFGIIGTVLMMALERKKEFGMLEAIGLDKGQIQMLVFIESLLLGTIGVVVALCIALPFVGYMYYHPVPLIGEAAKSFRAMGVEPVLQFGFKPSLFVLMPSIVFAIMLLASLPPIYLVGRQRVSEAIK